MKRTFLFRASVHWSKNISRKFLVHRPLQIVVKLRHMKNNSNFTQNLSNQMRYYFESHFTKKFVKANTRFDFISMNVSISRKIRQMQMKDFSLSLILLLISRKKISDDIAILWGSRKILIPPSYIFS